MECRTSQADLANEIGGTDRTVRTYLRELATAGYVSAVRNGRESIYTLLGGPEENFRSERKSSDQPDRKSGAGADLDLGPDLKPLPDKDYAPTPARAPKEKLDTKRGQAFIARFEAWYLKVYGRHLSPAKFHHVKRTVTLLEDLDRTKGKTGLFETNTSEEVVASALTIAVRNKYEVWPLSKGDPLTLDAFLGHWPRIWDRMQTEAQRNGMMKKGVENV